MPDRLSTVAIGMVVAAAMAGSSTATRTAGAQCPSPAAHDARRIPAFFDQGRVLAAPVSATGDTSYFILDSGGGFNAIAASAVARFRLTPRVRGTGADTMSVVPFPPFIDSMHLPRPKAGSPGPGYLAVTTMVDRFGAMYPVPLTGFLGGGWWADRVWRIDYPAEQLWLFPRSVLPKAGGGALGPHEVRLTFRTKHGRRPTNFARFRAEVGGDTLDLLFDTGATTQFSDSAMAIVHDGRPAARGGSFISSEIFDRWHQQHPEWRVIPRGEMRTHAAMIEVPSMRLGGYAIGPVWWEERGSADFHRLMDPLMDKPIQGSLGGAAFRHLAITVDYVAGVACFEAPMKQGGVGSPNHDIFRTPPTSTGNRDRDAPIERPERAAAP
jgi:hypothetical protein